MPGGNPASRGVAKGAPRTASNEPRAGATFVNIGAFPAHCWPHAQWTGPPFPKTPILLRRKEEK